MNNTPANLRAARRLSGQIALAGVSDRISASRSGGMGISGAFARLADRKAEAAVIASTLSNPPIVGWRGVRDEARRCGLGVEDFAGDVRHGELFALVLAAPADVDDLLAWIADELNRRGRLALLGGRNYLDRLARWDGEAYRGARWSPGGADTVRWLAPVLRRYTIYRKIVSAGVRLARWGLDGGEVSAARAVVEEIDAALRGWPDEAPA